MTGAARHPWNTSFEWRRPGTTPRRLTSDQIDAFDRDGWLVVEQLLDPSTVQDDPARQYPVLQCGVAVGGEA